MTIHDLSSAARGIPTPYMQNPKMGPACEWTTARHPSLSLTIPLS